MTDHKPNLQPVMDTRRLPININELLKGRVVEHDRLEYKEGWNPDPIMRTICAFANDFENLGGGYIIIGVEDDNGRPVLPPKGIQASELDTIQKKLLEFGNQIHPPYFPVCSIETIRSRKVVVLWCPGGSQRPYKAPKSVSSKEKEYCHYIRRYSNSVVAKDEDLQELIGLAADVPVDDRICHGSDLRDLKLTLIQSFLSEVKSELLQSSASMPFEDLCRQMMIVDGPPEYLKPRNVGLLFFNDQPQRFFPLVRIEVVHFIDGVGGNQLVEQIFTGPLDHQLRQVLTYLQNQFIRERVVKHPDRAEADRFFNYPYAAIEEALVNAVYHRSYELREPIEVRVNPESIEILSYPGAHRSITLESLNSGQVIARRYRNRRVGDILKELDLTEGRSTGIPKIRRALQQNGSPLPVFETDEDRTYFLARIPVHPGFLPDDGHRQDQQTDQQTDQAGDQEGGHDALQLNPTEKKILMFCAGRPRRQSEISKELGYSGRTRNVRTALEHLRSLGLIAYTIPDKPRSKDQRYTITPRGKAYLHPARP